MTGIPTGSGSEPGGSRVELTRMAVVQALERLERGERDALDGLEEALAPWVRALKERGDPAEAVLATVAELVGAPATPEGQFALTATVRAALVDLALSWSAAVFNPEPSSDGAQLPPTSTPPPDTPQITS